MTLGVKLHRNCNKCVSTLPLPYKRRLVARHIGGEAQHPFTLCDWERCAVWAGEGRGSSKRVSRRARAYLLATDTTLTCESWPAG